MTAPNVLNRPQGVGGRPSFMLRAGGVDDHNFIFATWLRSYKYSSAFARNVPDATYFRYHQQAIARILERGARVEIAGPASGGEVILGYLVSEKGVIHFAYVKKPFRRMGIARTLLETVDPNSCVFTHDTSDWQYIRKLYPHSEYNPYLI